MHEEAFFSHRFPFSTGLAVVGVRVDGKASSRQEFAPNLDVLGVQQLNQILHNDVHAILVKIAVITEAKEIELQGFAFHQAFVGNVGNIDGGEIRLARHGAQAGKFRAIEFDKIVVIDMAVIKSLQNIWVVFVNVVCFLIAKRVKSFISSVFVMLAPF